MRRPNLAKIEKMLDKGEDFSLTMEQCKQKTGADFPKGKNYAENKSAVSKSAKSRGFTVSVIPSHIEFRKIKGQ